ncbi:hypothetical protein ACH47C_33710 [Streptomyces rishiriensis]|uniref:hypothetical protein n=1 Tax=Streptomyces rishiriensis TaxID=68264 RepID=UPI0033C8D6A9
MTLTTRTKATGAVLAAALAGSAALVSSTHDDRTVDDRTGAGRAAAEQRRSGQGGTGRVSLPGTKEGIPSRTATDWVSYGDQVAVVRVLAEHERPDPETQDEAAGAGTYVPRTVDLRVTDRLWARPAAAALPGVVSVTVDGWQLHDGVRERVASQDAARLEVGHTYVISFARYEDGVWAQLGSGAALPYDHGRVGSGEFAGHDVTVDAYRSALERQRVPGEEAPVALRTAGKTADDVQKVLRSAEPDPRATRPARTTEPTDTFCSVASPLATSESGRHTPDELASVLTDLAAMASKPADASVLRSYATSLGAGTGAGKPDDTARAASVVAIERACGIDVGFLRPTDD